MKKWEYTAPSTIFGGVGLPNDVASLGIEGWEVCGSIIVNGTTVQLIFKREKISSKKVLKPKLGK